MAKSKKNPPLITPSKPTSKEATSPFIQTTTSLYLTLSPPAYAFPLEGLIAEHISPHLMTYYPPLHGILLSIDNARLSTTKPTTTTLPTPPPDSPEPILAQSHAEYATSYLWLTADFLVFRPERGTTLQGKVNVQSESVVGLMCYNYFNAAIEAEKLPEGWEWDGEQWMDGAGEAVHGRVFEFRVEDFEATGQETVTIVGTLAA